jgi:hypothetical protein
MEHNSEAKAIRRALGKWSRPGAPRLDWAYTDIDDIESPDHNCEMCECSPKHKDYHEVLACGCVCAGHMQQDYEVARKRQIWAPARPLRHPY